MIQYGRPSRSSWTESVRSSFSKTDMGEAIGENSSEIRLGKSSKLGLLFRQPRKKTILACVCGRKKWLGRNKTLTQCGKHLRKKSIRENQHHSLTMSVKLGYTQRECETSKNIVENYRDMFESRISAGAKERLPYSEKPDAHIFHGLVIWKVMRRNAWQDIANLRISRLSSCVKSQALLRWSPLQERGTWISERIVKSMLTHCPEMPVFGTQW